MHNSSIEKQFENPIGGYELDFKNFTRVQGFVIDQKWFINLQKNLYHIMATTKGGISQEYLDKLTFTELDFLTKAHNSYVEDVNNQLKKGK